MQKTWPKRYLSRLSAAAILLAAVAVRPSERPIEVYTVIPNDTLWDLSEQFFSDPTLWKNIWQSNRHIRHPDWIYPGDTLSIELPKTTPAPTYSRVTKKYKQEPRNTIAESVYAESVYAESVYAEPAYVDQLIDPDVAEDNYFDELSRTSTTSSSWRNVDHSIELHSLYRESSQLSDGTLDVGLHYIARRNTRNWGNFRLNLIALDENQGTTLNQSTAQGLQQSQSGLVRFSLEQYNLPITDKITLNNVIGTHRQSRYNPFRERPNLINYRFSAAEPDVLGVSSQLLAGQTGLSVSAGRLGQSRGNLLPGFVHTSGNIKRVQATHVRDRHAFTTDIWETSDQQTIDNRRGYRLGYDRLLGSNTVLSVNAVGSGGQRAFLMGGATTTERAQHDFGSYFFDPDLIWLDQRIGDDNLGGFYRYQTRAATHNWGGSIEVRKDGVSDTAAQSSTSAYLSLNMAYRLSRKSTLNNVYNFRNVSYSGQADENLREHSIRSYYTRTHVGSARSNLSLLARTRQRQQELTLSYGWAKDLQNDSSVELSTNYRTQFTSDDTSREWLVNTSWSKQFRRGTYLSAGLGYNFGRSTLDDNRGLTSYLNLEQTFGQDFSLSMQLDYSNERTRYDDPNIADSFFTNNQFEDDTTTGSQQFFALLSLRYQKGGSAGVEVLQGRGRSNGAGSLRGYVYVDSNNDGIRQASEPGVPGVTVFLNSVYPVLTNNRGEYSFPNVGLGGHFLFVDESALPLPWTLSHGEYTPVSIELRRATQMNIPVSPITLADAD